MAPGEVYPHACASHSRQRVLILALERPFHHEQRAVAESHGGLIDAAAAPHAEDDDTWGFLLLHDGVAPVPEAIRERCVEVSGLAAELLKMVIRRGRPAAVFEGYGFQGWEGAWWNTAALGLPSSHAAVAFGAAWSLLRLSPRGGPVAVAIAFGCGVTRILDRAHFISDVALAAGLAWFITAVLWQRWPIK